MAEELGLHKSPPWQIIEDGHVIIGTTSMDNFDMHFFLKHIGVPLNRVFWARAILRRDRDECLSLE